MARCDADQQTSTEHFKKTAPVKIESVRQTSDRIVLAKLGVAIFQHFRPDLRELRSKITHFSDSRAATPHDAPPR
jgi:hypothetical protein